MSGANLSRSHQMSRRLAMPTGLLLAALLLALALTGGRWSGAAAQEATPGMATPAVECMPAAADGAMVEATPVVGAMATPAATPEPVGTPADATAAEAVVAAAENAVACYNAGDVDAFLSLVTDDFIVNVLGFESREAAATGLAEEIVPLENVQIDAGSVQTYDDGRASVDASYTQLGNQYVEARWFFVPSGSDYLLDDEVILSPEPDVDFVTIISATVDEEPVRFDQSPAVTATDAVIIHVINNSDEEHEFVLVRLPEGTTLNEDGTLPEDLADLNSLFGMVESGEVTVVGYAAVEAGGRQDVAFLDLPPGVYALVDFTGETVIPLTINEATE